LLAFLIVLLATPSVFGITGIGAGGIPGLILTTDILTNFSDFSAAYLNPALLTGIDQAELTIGTRWWGVRGVVWSPKYGSVSVPFDLNHTAAFSVLQLGLSNVPKTNAKGEIIEREFISAAEYVLQGSYAYKILPFLSLGTNVTSIIPDVADEGELGITGDLGIRFHPIEDYLLGKVSLGLNVQNVVYLDLGRSFGDEFNKYPLNIHVQFHWFNEYYRTFLERFELSFNCAVMDLITEAENFGNPENTVSIQNMTQQDAEKVLKDAGEKFRNISVVYGAHAKWFPFKFFGIRSGINTNGVIPFGVSLNWKHVNILKRVQLDYDFGISIEDSLPKNSQSTHVIRAVFRFGPTREEAVSEKWYRQLVKEPQNDFNEAMRLYLAKKYWLASFAFGKVLAKWPSFSKVDIATFYMGKSYEYLHMYDVARETYNRGLKKYYTSDFRPKFIFQLQNLDYKTSDYDNALKHYGFIMNLYRDSDIAADADYVAGQIYYTKKDFESAINVLNSVEPDNENYLYSQYTLAMLNVHRKNFDDAIEHLNNIVNVDSVRTVSEKSLREMAYVKLGHIFFEQGELKFAYGAYKQVSPESRFYDEALLGLAWTYVRGGVEQSYNEAVKTADALVSSRSKSMLVAEAYLVMGYALTLLKKYNQAVDAYKNVIKLCDARYISRAEFKERESKHTSGMRQYLDFQKKALGLALRKPTPALLAQKDKMTPQWQQYDEEIRDFSVFRIQANEQFEFKRKTIKLKKDAEYALATTLHLIETEKKVKIIKDTQEKEEEIETEMEELQKELQELEE
jgi:tetratricopeptide (TPR) repeat protein